jgi:hypothetical protein
MFVGETDDSTQVRAPLHFLEFGLRLSQIRGRDSAKPADCQRFKLKNNPNLLTTNNQKIRANLLDWGCVSSDTRSISRITAGP